MQSTKDPRAGVAYAPRTPGRVRVNHYLPINLVVYLASIAEAEGISQSYALQRLIERAQDGGAAMPAGSWSRATR
jgi:hypothetical protein